MAALGGISFYGVQERDMVEVLLRGDRVDQLVKQRKMTKFEIAQQRLNAARDAGEQQRTQAREQKQRRQEHEREMQRRHQEYLQQRQLDNDEAECEDEEWEDETAQQMLEEEITPDFSKVVYDIFNTPSSARHSKADKQRESHAQRISQVPRHSTLKRSPTASAPPSGAARGRSSGDHAQSQSQMQGSSALAPLAGPAASAAKPTEAGGALPRQRRTSLRRIENLNTRRLSVIQQMNKSKRKKRKWDKLLSAKRREFEHLSKEEQDQLKQAFNSCVQDSTTGALTRNQLVLALWELGLHPATDRERKDVKQILNEVCLFDVDFKTFALEAVPRVRKRLRELRLAPLLKSFAFYDSDKSGALDVEELMQIVTRRYKWNLDATGCKGIDLIFDDIFKAVKDPVSDSVDFGGFQVLVGQLEDSYRQILGERARAIFAEERVSKQDAENFGDDIVHLHQAYCNKVEWHGRVDRARMREVLLDLGLLPRKQDGAEWVDSVFAQADAESSGDLTFAQYLQVISDCRRWMERSRRGNLNALFNHFDTLQVALLTDGQIRKLINKLDLVPSTNREDFFIIKRTIEEADAKARGEYSFQDLQALVSRLVEHSTILKRFRERELANELGFSDVQYQELMEAFITLDADGSELLEIHEVREAMAVMSKMMSKQELERLGRMLEGYNDEVMDFDGFLRFMAAVILGTG